MLLFFLEVLAGVPLLHAVAQQISSDVGIQVAVVTLIMSFIGAALVVLVNKPIGDFIEKLYPPSVSEVLSEPLYLNNLVAQSPETGLVLVEKEQANLLDRLPLYLDYVRSKDDRSSMTQPVAYHEACQKISDEITKVLSNVSGQGLNTSDSANLIRITKTQELIVSLEDIVFKVASRIDSHEDSTAVSKLGNSILESMDFMILTALDAIKSQSMEDIDTLKMMTGDRSQMMDKIRRNYFQSEQDLSEADRNFILDITILFENAALTLDRYVSLLKA